MYFLPIEQGLYVKFLVEFINIIKKILGKILETLEISKSLEESTWQLFTKLSNRHFFAVAYKFVVVIDGSAIFWTIEWPRQGTVADLIDTI